VLIVEDRVAVDDLLGDGDDIVQRFRGTTVLEEQGRQFVDLPAGNIDVVSITQGLHAVLLARIPAGVKLDAYWRGSRFVSDGAIL
jgi:hypothetical protein